LYNQIEASAGEQIRGTLWVHFMGLQVWFKDEHMPDSLRTIADDMLHLATLCSAGRDDANGSALIAQEAQDFRRHVPAPRIKPHLSPTNGKVFQLGLEVVVTAVCSG